MRLTILEDSLGHEIPILLPVDLLTSLGAIIDLGRLRLELTALFTTWGAHTSAAAASGDGLPA